MKKGVLMKRNKTNTFVSFPHKIYSIQKLTFLREKTQFILSYKICHIETYYPYLMVRTCSTGYRYTDRPILLQCYNTIL